MKPVYIKYLVESVIEIFSENFDITPKKKKVSFYTHGLKIDVAASIGLIGNFEGNIMLFLDKKVALQIASSMFQDKITELDDLSLSAISELVNFTAGRMITKLFQLDYDNDITPPDIFVNKTIEFDHKLLMAVRILFESELGQLEFALAKRKKT